jgi:hypothetical protein
MIPDNLNALSKEDHMNWEDQLIQLYCDVCDLYQRELWQYCERFSNNAHPEFTDEEVITIYLFGIMEKRFAVAQIYKHTQDHLHRWFQHLPSYGGYIQRLNKLSAVFPPLLNALAPVWAGGSKVGLAFLLDSMPIILARGSRRFQAKVAREVADCGYCASKKLSYYGLKLHVLGIRQPGTLPHPDYLELTSARPHDLTVLEGIAPYLQQGELYADKAYVSEVLEALLAHQEMVLLTPTKKAKGQEKLHMFEQLWSTSVSRVRQPIESFFSWLERTTGIQMASTVRSLNGLLVHVYGRLAAAMYMLSFNS